MSGADGTPVLRRYYAAMDAGDVELIQACFTEDAAFILPGRPERGGELRLRTGRAAIAEFFRRRGEPAERHVLIAVDGSESHQLVEGLVVRNSDGAAQPFLAGVRISGDGLISRYLVLTAPASAALSARWSAEAGLS